MRELVLGVLLASSVSSCSAQRGPEAEPRASSRQLGVPSRTQECTSKRAPTVARKPTTTSVHGQPITDEYEWLEHRDDPAVQRFSQEQNGFARSLLDSLPGRDRVSAQVRELMSTRAPSWSMLQHHAGQIFAIEEHPPLQQPYLVVMHTPDAAAERVVVDPNRIDPTGGTTIDWYRVSDDAKWAAVSLSQGGSETGSVHVFDVASGAERKQDLVPYAQGGTAGGSLAWTHDATGFWYTRYPHPGERPLPDLDFYQQIYFHELGTPTEQDRPILVDGLPKIAEIQLDRSDDGRSLLATVQNGDGGEFELFLLDTHAKQPAFRKLASFDDQVVEAKFGPDGAIWLRSLHHAPRGRLLSLEPAQADLTRARVIVPESAAVIQDFEVTKTRLFAVDMVQNQHQVRRFDLRGRAQPSPILLPTSSVGELVRLEGDDVLFSNQSYLEPPAWYQWREQAGGVQKSTLAEVAPAHFDDAEVVHETCTSKDGTAVPLTILRRKGTPMNSKNPLLLYGYGGFGISLGPSYQALQRVWLDRGGIFAVANLRGGSEFGEAWHQAGMLTHKQNVFDDFIACARHVTTAGYTSPEHLAIAGASNGGLLMGAALTQAPELFRAVVSKVGIYDMLRVESTPNGTFNVTEFGTVTNDADFRALYDYSPYHHVRDRVAYPAVLFMTGENDPRVDPFHSRKMTARLQAATQSCAPILLRTSGNTGHGMGSPLDARVEQQTDQFAFLFSELDMPAPKTPAEVPEDTSTAGVVGYLPSEWQASPWFNSAPLTLAELRGRVVFVRWFTSPDCPFCQGSAAALRELHARYQKRGLAVVGMYHHKDPTPLNPEDVRGWAKHYGYEFPVAIDADWRTLKRWWLDGHPERAFTSVSFLIDRKGVIRRVHRGGLIDANSDEFRSIEGDVERLLAERN